MYVPQCSIGSPTCWLHKRCICKTVDQLEQSIQIYTKQLCNFNYRHSYFKHWEPIIWYSRRVLRFLNHCRTVVELKRAWGHFDVFVCRNRHRYRHEICTGEIRFICKANSELLNILVQHSAANAKVTVMLVCNKLRTRRPELNYSVRHHLDPGDSGRAAQEKAKDKQKKRCALTLRHRCGRYVVGRRESTDDLSFFHSGVAFVIAKNALQCIWTADGGEGWDVNLHLKV